METFLFGLFGCFIMALPFLLLIWLIWAMRRRRNRPSIGVRRFRQEETKIEREAQRRRDVASAQCLEDMDRLTRKR